MGSALGRPGRMRRLFAGRRRGPAKQPRRGKWETRGGTKVDSRHTVLNCIIYAIVWLLQIKCSLESSINFFYEWLCFDSTKSRHCIYMYVVYDEGLTSVHCQYVMYWRYTCTCMYWSVELVGWGDLFSGIVANQAENRERIST